MIRRYEKIIEYLEKKPPFDVKIGDIATIMGMSQATLNKKFYGDMGISVKKYLNKITLHKAKDLLFTHHSIKEIAFLLGFKDEFYFSRYFKSHTKMSPSQYRKYIYINRLRFNIFK